jgi:hypothetical protein
VLFSGCGGNAELVEEEGGRAPRNPKGAQGFQLSSKWDELLVPHEVIV